MKVNKLVYILLALFLGSAGIHKFYEGKYGMGVLYLLLCWTGVPVFLALFDIIKAAFAETDEYGNFLHRYRR